MKEIDVLKEIFLLMKDLDMTGRVLLWREIAKNPPVPFPKLLLKKPAEEKKKISDMRFALYDAKERVEDLADDIAHLALTVQWLQNDDLKAYGALRTLVQTEENADSA